MRIGFFLDEWADGGIPIFLDRLEKCLAQQGHEVIFFVLRPHRKRDPLSKKLYLVLKKRIERRYVSLDLDFFPGDWKKAHFQKTLLESCVECLLASQCLSSLGYLRSIAETIPVITISHADSDYYYHEFLLAETIHRAHIAVSERIRERCSYFAAFDRRKMIHRIPCGIDSGENFCPAPQGRFSVVHCCRLDPLQKRVHDLVPLWKAYRSLGGKGRIVMIGSGKAESLLQEAFAEEIRSGDVIWHGYLPGDKTLAEIAQGDVFLSLSNFEGMPQAVLEAVSLGLYPVLSDIASGHGEIVRQIGHGTLCPLGDIHAYARELIRLEQELPVLRKQRTDIRERALQEYSLELCSARYLALFQQVVRDYPSKKIAPTSYAPTWGEKVKRWMGLIKYRRHYPLFTSAPASSVHLSRRKA